MKVRELRAAIEDAERMLAAAGARQQSAAVQAFAALLAGHDEQPVGPFLADLGQRIDAPATTLLVARLQAAGTDEAQFAEALADLKRDRALRKEDVDLIAHAYTEGRKHWPSKREAIDAIERAFRARAYDAVKMKQVDKAALVR